MKSKMLVVTLFLSLSAYAQAGFMAVANVSKIQGKALINKEKIKEGAEIAEGMTLTIPNAKDFVEVKFQNGHLVRFTGATVKVLDLNPKTTLFNLLRGKVYSSIKPLTENETYQIKTKRASFAARGTKFYVEETKKDSYLLVLDGVVSVKSKKAEVEVKKDEDLRLASAGGELKATVAAKSVADMMSVVFKDMGI